MTSVRGSSRWPAYSLRIREEPFSDSHKLESVSGAEVLRTPAPLKLRLVLSYLNNYPYYPYPHQRVRQAAPWVHFLPHLLPPQ
jgi:hypothetical protein